MKGRPKSVIPDQESVTTAKVEEDSTKAMAEEKHLGDSLLKDGTQKSKDREVRVPRRERLLEVQNPMEAEGELVSDDDEDATKIGNVPLWWYDKYDHIGYDNEGTRIQKKVDQSCIGELLSREDPDKWRRVKDIRDNREIVLSDRDLQLINRIRNGQYPSALDPSDFTIASDNEDSIFPLRNVPVSKNQFLPSKHEQKRITHLIKLLRSGVIRDSKDNAIPVEDDTLDLWGNSVFSRYSSGAGRGVHYMSAPKLPLPGHNESYNPPEEYLFTPEEKQEWESLEPELRPTNFIPQRYQSLRHVGAYKDLLLERFNRCLDLYLCPRTIKMRMNVDPESLLPNLPSPSELKPFPVAKMIDYLPMDLYAQRTPNPQPLYAYLLPFLQDMKLNESKNAQSTTDDAVHCTAVDSTGEWLASGGSDNHIRVTELRTGKVFASYKLQQCIRALSFHPSLPILAAAAGEQLMLLALDLPVCDDLACISEQTFAKKKCISASNVNEEIAEGSRQWKVMKANEWLQIREQEGSHLDLREVTHKNNADEISPYVIDEKSASDITGVWYQVSLKHASKARSNSKALVEQNLDEEAEKAQGTSSSLQGVQAAVFIMHDSNILQLRWHPKGTYLISTCPGSSSPSNQLYIHSLAKQRTLRPLRKRGCGTIKCAVFHPSKPWLFVAYQRGIRLYDLQAKQSGSGQVLLKKFIGVDGVTSMDIHPSGNQLIVGGDNRKVYFFDLEMNDRVYKTIRHHSHAITSVSFHLTLPLMCTSSLDGSIQVYYCKVYDDLMTNPMIVPVKKLTANRNSNKSGVLSCSWHPSQPWLVSGDKTGGCALWM